LKVLIIRPAALGDTLMLMPAITQIKAVAEIFLVGRSAGVELLRPHVHRSIDFEGSGWHRLFVETPDLEPSFPLPKADSVVAFLSDPDGIVSNNLKTHLPKASIHFFPAFPPKEADIHVAFYLAQCLKRAGLPIDPEKTLDEACKRPLLGGVFQPGQGRKAVFHPGSGGKGKNYPPEFWLELVRKIGGHGGFILLGPAEEELLPFFTTNVRMEGIEILFLPEKEQLIAILRQAPLYVGHDSGITHLAAMLGTPTIALFKNTPIHQWRPLGPAVRVIENEENRETLIGKVLEEAGKFIGKRHPNSTFPAE